MMALIHGRFAGESLAVMHETGMTLPQLVALHILDHGGPASVSALSGLLRLSLSATSHLVDKTVEKGFITRAEDPDDRRQKRIALTPEGRALLERLNAERIDEFTRAFGSLDPDFQAQLQPIFAQLIRDLAANHPLSQE